MILIPRNLSSFATLCPKESTKFALTGVKLSVRDDGSYRVAATDSKVLALVDGKARHNPDEFPVPIDHLPNGKSEALIPAKDWKTGLGKPLPGRLTQAKPVIGETAVVIGDNVATFVATDLERTQQHQAQQVEGRFPPVEEILPKTKPAAVAKIDPALMIKLLKVAQELMSLEPDGAGGVTLEFHRDGHPLIVRAENQSQKLTALIMPLS